MERRIGGTIYSGNHYVCRLHTGSCRDRPSDESASGRKKPVKCFRAGLQRASLKVWAGTSTHSLDFRRDFNFLRAV